MPLNVNEIIQGNRDYYYGTYSFYLRTYTERISCIIVCIMGVLAYLIKQACLKRKYILEAGTIDLEAREVMEWVDEQLKINRWDSMTLFILAVTILLIAYILLIYRFIKGYDLYKPCYKYAFVIPVILSLIMLIYLSIKMSTEIGIWQISNKGIALLIMDMLPIIAVAKLLLPLENKAPMENLLQCLDFMAQAILKEF